MTDAELQGLLSLARRPHVVIAFNKILIANRGEIACRIIRTAKALGYRTVAVFSDADAGARHVRQADEAVRIGPPPRGRKLPRHRGPARGREARRRRCRASRLRLPVGECRVRRKPAPRPGLVFIGPPPAAIDAMGNKARAKALMEAAGVPCVPGYQGADSVRRRVDGGRPAHRLPAHGQGRGGRRRTRHAARRLRPTILPQP